MSFPARWSRRRKESGVKDVADDLKAVTSAKSLGLNKVKEAADRFEKWDPIKNAAKPTAARQCRQQALGAAADACRGPGAEPAVAECRCGGAQDIGAETQALMDKQAAKKAILAETAEKLKAVDTGIAASKAEVKPAVKPRVRKPAVSRQNLAEAQPASKPRAAPNHNPAQDQKGG